MCFVVKNYNYQYKHEINENVKRLKWVLNFFFFWNSMKKCYFHRYNMKKIVFERESTSSSCGIKINFRNKVIIILLWKYLNSQGVYSLEYYCPNVDNTLKIFGKIKKSSHSPHFLNWFLFSVSMKILNILAEDCVLCLLSVLKKRFLLLSWFVLDVVPYPIGCNNFIYFFVLLTSVFYSRTSLCLEIGMTVYSVCMKYRLLKDKKKWTLFSLNVSIMKWTSFFFFLILDFNLESTFFISYNFCIIYFNIDFTVIL